MKTAIILFAFIIGATALAKEDDEIIDLPNASRMGLPCANACRLFLCSSALRRPGPRANGFPNLLRATGLRMGGSFCSNRRLLHDVQIGEALVSPQRSGDDYIPISSYMPPGLDTPFRRKYFKVLVGPNGEESLTRGRIAGNQNEKVDNLCVTIPIKEYRPTTKSGRIGSRVVTTSAQDCVSMRVIASKLQFELSWNNTDDFDLVVTEPNGDQLDNSDRISDSGGRFNSDNGLGKCDLDEIPGESTREVVSYDIEDPVQTGTYKVQATQFASCEKSSASFVVRVVVDGRVVKARRGIARLGETTSMKFRFRRLP